MTQLPQLLRQIRGCCECEQHLPLGPRPIVQAGRSAKILIVGQAPSRRVHATGIPWNDPSGERLRAWMGIERKAFYDPKVVALVPMGFCYPGTGDSGDIGPRKECAMLWHSALLSQLKHIQLTLLIGKYAQDHYLPEMRTASLTATVNNWKSYAPAIFPLPHPSPRNNRWLKNNPWFESALLPVLQRRTKAVLAK